MELEHDWDLGMMSPALRADIMKHILEKISDGYAMASSTPKA